MSDFDVAAHLKSNAYARKPEVYLDPIPSKLTVEHEEGNSYYLNPLIDGSSLVWIYLTSDTFDELIPGYHWTVDDPGTLYFQETPNGEPIDDEADESLVPLSAMQSAADVLLERYRAVVEQLVLEGKAVNEYGEKYGSEEDDEDED